MKTNKLIFALLIIISVSLIIIFGGEDCEADHEFLRMQCSNITKKHTEYFDNKQKTEDKDNNKSNSSPPSTQHYFLSLLVIAKNERMVIEEFVEHYKWQGVEHIYLIDNGSTDKMIEILQPYINKNYISYYYLPEKFHQVSHYNRVFREIKNQTKWLIICDADEYMYHRIQGKNIQSYLKTVNYNTINAIVLNWKMFGSSQYKSQPKSIRQSFIWRKKEYDENVKSIVNTSHTISLNIHTHQYSSSSSSIISNPHELALNHYAIMSFEYFKKIKMTRGSASTILHNNVRNLNYFQKYDHHEMQDTELQQLSQ